MRIQTTRIISFVIVLWICKVFLSSLPYKFTQHPDTQHIFGTIGSWMQGILGDTIGGFFANYGPYLVGGAEMLTSIILLTPIVVWLLAKAGLAQKSPAFAKFYQIGGLMASCIMAGAVFFHLATPLGVEVLHEGKSDGGSLFYAATSILFLGIVLFFINRSSKPASA